MYCMIYEMKHKIALQNVIDLKGVIKKSTKVSCPVHRHPS